MATTAEEKICNANERSRICNAKWIFSI